MSVREECGDARVLRFVPSYVGFFEALHLRSLARDAQAWVSDPTAWRKLQLTTSSVSMYKIRQWSHEGGRADCTLGCWNSLPVAFRKRVAANVASLIIHVC